jgi:hypothetical protein
VLKKILLGALGSVVISACLTAGVAVSTGANAAAVLAPPTLSAPATLAAGTTNPQKLVALLHVPGAENGGHFGGTGKTKLSTFYILDRRVGQCYIYSSGTPQFVGDGTWKITAWVYPVGLVNECAGTAILTVAVMGTDDTRTTDVSATLTVTVQLKRASRFSALNASPEPVKKGGTVTTKATIQRANWDDHKYHAYAGQPSELQFRTTTGNYANVKAVTAKTGGKLTGSAKQNVKGCWRYTFAGTSITAPVTAAGDCVAIKH